MNFLPTLKRAVPIGIAGTLVMTAFTYLAGLIHFPRFDYHAMIHGLVKTGALGTWLIYLVAGIALAYAYKAFFKEKLPTHSWKKGILYGLILWGVTQLIFMPVFGMGFFSGSLLAVLGMLIGDVFFGAIVGYMYAHEH